MDGYSSIAWNITSLWPCAGCGNEDIDTMITLFRRWLPLRMFCSREVEYEIRTAQAVFVPNLLSMDKEMENLLETKIPCVKPSKLRHKFEKEIATQEYVVETHVPMAKYFVEVYIEFVMLCWWKIAKISGDVLDEYDRLETSLLPRLGVVDKWQHRDVVRETNGIQWFPHYLFALFDWRYDVTQLGGHYDAYTFPTQWDAGVAWMPYDQYQNECLRHEEILALKKRDGIMDVANDDPNFMCTWALYHANLSAYTLDQMCDYYKKWYKVRQDLLSEDTYGGTFSWCEVLNRKIRNFSAMQMEHFLLPKTRKRLAREGTFNFQDVQFELLPPSQGLEEGDYLNYLTSTKVWQEWCVMIWVYLMRMKRRHNQLALEEQQQVEALPQWTWIGDIYWELKAWTLDHFFGFKDLTNRATEEKIFTFQLHQLRLEEANKRIHVKPDPECVIKIRQRNPTNEFYAQGAIGDDELSKNCHTYMNHSMSQDMSQEGSDGAKRSGEDEKSGVTKAKSQKPRRVFYEYVDIDQPYTTECKEFDSIAYHPLPKRPKRTRDVAEVKSSKVSKSSKESSETSKSPQNADPYCEASFTGPHRQWKLHMNCIHRNTCALYLAPTSNILYLDGPEQHTTRVFAPTSFSLWTANREPSTYQLLKTNLRINHVELGDLAQVLQTTWKDVHFGGFYFDCCTGEAAQVIKAFQAAIKTLPMVVGFTLCGRTTQAGQTQMKRVTEIEDFLRTQATITNVADLPEFIGARWTHDAILTRMYVLQ